MLAEDFSPWFVRGCAFFFGALWGSFFNVAIYRWPRDMSVVAPPSHCPACGAPVPWYRNVPIVAYLTQRGRAACCGAKMTARYLLVELLAGVLCLALAERLFVAHGSLEASTAAIHVLLYFAFCGALIVATFTDLEWMMIPDEVTLPAAALGLVSVEWRNVDAVSMAVGAGTGFLLVQLVFVWSYERLMGRRGMGEGDAKLLLAIGAFVGWKGVLFSVAAGSLQGVAAAVVGFLTGRGHSPELRELVVRVPENSASKVAAACDDADGERAAFVASDSDADAEADAEAEPERESGSDAVVARGPLKLPFGPFLALGALEWIFFGEELLAWYLALLE